MMLLLLLLLLLVLLLAHLLLVSHLATVVGVSHPHSLGWRLPTVIVSTPRAGAGLGLTGSLPGLVLLLLVVLRQELSLGVGDREVTEHVGGGEGLLLEVIVRHGLLTGVPLGGVHDQELLQQLECLGFRLYPVSVHVLHQGAVYVV